MELRYRYEGPDTCFIPVDLLGEYVIGCPSAVLREGEVVVELTYDPLGQVTCWQSFVRGDPARPSRPYLTYCYSYFADRTVRAGTVAQGEALDSWSTRLTVEGDHVLETWEEEGESAGEPRRWFLDQGRVIRYGEGKRATRIVWDGLSVQRAIAPNNVAEFQYACPQEAPTP